MTNIRTCLWMKASGEDAAKLYCELIPNSKITNVMNTGTMTITSFELDHVPFQIFSGNDHFKLTEAASIVYTTDSQADTDRLWDALTADGGKEMQCAWLTDRFGVTWQIVPKQLMNYLGSSDKEAADRAQTAMFTMAKIDIAAIEKAFRGE